MFFIQQWTPITWVSQPEKSSFFCENYVKLLLGYETYVIHDATRGISEQGIKEALQQMTNNDIKIINSSEVEDVLNSDNAGSEIAINLSMLISMLGIYLLAK